MALLKTAATVAATSTASMSDAVSGIFDVAGSAIDFVTGQPVLFTFFCAGVIGIGFGIVKKAKRV